MIPINKFPYTDFHEINLNWVIERIQEMYAIIDEKITQALAPVIADVNELKGRVTTLETNYSSLSEQVTINSNRINNITSQIQGLASTISGVMGDIQELSSVVSDHTNDINDIKGDVDTINTEIVDIYNKIAEIDPDTGLIIDADNFNIEEKTANILDPVYRFSLTGNTQDELFAIYPDPIPGTQTGFYPRVTMTQDQTTHKIKLPSELTTGDYPLIRRGTFATNVDVNAEIYTGDPLEYTIDGSTFKVDGYDSNAIILMNLACLHHKEDFENVYLNEGYIEVKGMPQTVNNRYAGTVTRGTSTTVIGLEPYVYFFDKDGNLLNYAVLDATLGNAIPTGTYSIWYGIHTTGDHELWTNTTFAMYLPTCAGVYETTENGFYTYHVVEFTSPNAWYKYDAYKAGINGLFHYDTIDMLTGEVTRTGEHLTNFTVRSSLSRLEPDTTYSVTLPYNNSGYTAAKLKYNKVMVLLNNLDANNTRY